VQRETLYSIIFRVVTSKCISTEFVNELILCCSVTLKGTKFSDIANLFEEERQEV
jgi:hypothetical protein